MDVFCIIRAAGRIVCDGWCTVGHGEKMLRNVRHVWQPRLTFSRLPMLLVTMRMNGSTYLGVARAPGVFWNIRPVWGISSALLLIRTTATDILSIRMLWGEDRVP
ncbi:hypothetical protein C8Q74DRAFT_1276760 [Fomes fomentarius]|nr:hypothetical protein C8Q74DRAFT_1276760 [Fomes fomentarius]